MSESTIDAAKTRQLRWAFQETLLQTLPPRDQSDATCFARIGDWLQAQVTAAVFVSLIKRSLGYQPGGAGSRRA